MLSRRFILSFICLILFTFSASAGTNKKYKDLRIRQVAFKNLKGWDKDRHDLAINAFVKSCDKIALLPNSKKIGAGIDNIKVKDFRNVCEMAKVIDGMSNKQAKKFFEDWFVPFEVSNIESKKNGLFTGYYEIELHGRREKDSKYKYPIFAKPEDFDGKSVYKTREEIEDGLLEGKNLEIFYVDDKVDLFFLHIQGSGRVVLENNVIKRIGFSAKNNQPYTSIGKVLIDRKILKKDKVSAGSIKEWLRNNPYQAEEIMYENKSFVFFKELEDDYIRGAQGSVLIPERSLAVDKDIVPFGFPIWLETTLPIEGKGKVPYNRLLVSQDTGSAIKGAVRGDVFFGFGERAEELASYMKQKGKYYILLPINVAERIKRK